MHTRCLKSALALSLALAGLTTLMQPRALAFGGFNLLALESKSDAQPSHSHVHLREKWALLIGANKFQDPSLPATKECANNIRMLQAALTDPNAGRFNPGRVRTLVGTAATKSGITAAWQQWLEKEVLPDDLVLVYLCAPAAAATDGKPLFCCYDTLASEADQSALDLQPLLAELKRRSQSKFVLCAIDSSPVAGSKGFDLSKLAGADASVLSATDGHQKSLNNGVTGTSVFIHHFIEALKLEGGNFTVAQACDHVRKSVAGDAVAAFHTTQTPSLLVEPDSQIEETVLGARVKSSSPGPSFAVGHPLSRLALERPDLIPPRDTAPPAPRAAAKNAGAHLARLKNTSVDDEDDDKPHQPVDFGAYMAKMKATIQKHWTPPQTLEDRVISAVFTITRDGRIVDAHILQGSGSDEIDKTALDALKAASPLDPLPAGSPDSVDIKYKFDWQVKRN